MKMKFRHLLLLSLCLLFLFTIVGYASGQETSDSSWDSIDIYLLIGQSNMAGRAPIEDEDAIEGASILLLNADDQWEEATHPLNQYSTIRKTLSMQRLNIGASFARSMREADPATTVGLVVNAKGGTAIELWGKDTTFYDEAVRRTKAAQTAGGTLRGILWHQGESNSESPDYLDKLEQLIADLREDLESPNLPFVAGQVSMVKGDRLVNRLLLQLPERVESTGCVSSEEMIVFDGAHFDPPSTRELGRRYATIMRELHEEAEEE